MENNDKYMMKLTEAAAYLGISPAALERIKRRREISYIKISNRCIRYSKEDCDAYIARHKVAAGTTSAPTLESL